MSRNGRLSCFPPPSTSSLEAGSSQPKARCSAAFLFTHPPLPFRNTALSRIALVHGPFRLLQHSHIRKILLVLQNQVHTSRKCRGPTHPLQLALDDLQEPRAVAWADQCFAPVAIARFFRKVVISLTMTTNPQWIEILRELLPGQMVYDRPNLVAHVFQLKKQELLDYIYKHGVFGHAVAYVYTIEFQKCGLPHMHCLI